MQDEYGNYLFDEYGHPIVVQQAKGPSVGIPGTPTPPPPVSSLIPLRDDSGNIIVDDFGQIIYVDGSGGTAGVPPPASAAASGAIGMAGVGQGGIGKPVQ